MYWVFFFSTYKKKRREEEAIHKPACITIYIISRGCAADAGVYRARKTKRARDTLTEKQRWRW